MFTLKPAQQTHAEVIYRSLLTNGSALDTSETGTGKTVTSIVTAKHWQEVRGPVAIVCPAAVVTAWKRAAEKQGVNPLFVLSYDKLRKGNSYYGIVTRGKKTSYFRAALPEDTLVIFDEVHYCRGETTQNSKLLVATVKAGAVTLNLSATAAKDPSQMKALGYALGLHTHNSKGRDSWFSWVKRNGCYQDPWFRWKLRKSFDLSPLRDTMFHQKKLAHGMRVSDLPEDFEGVTIQTELRNFPRVAGIYDKAGVDETYVNTVLTDLDDKKLSGAAAEAGLRARQLAEIEKIPYLIEQTRDLLEQGFSPVVFLNFRESISLFRESVPESGVIIGGQSSTDRQQYLDDFNDDKFRVMVVSASAGGTGISLHDTKGHFPRVGLVCPSFSPFIFKQILGRLPRLGMKSPALYRVVVAANTIEEHVQKMCAEGTKNMESLFMAHGRRP